MFELVDRMKRWLSASARMARPAPPYEVSCTCGHIARGFRGSRYQVLRCPACGQPIFVLGRSPLPPANAARGDTDNGAAGERSPRRPLIPRPWRLPLVAAIITLSGVIVVFWIILRHLDTTVLRHPSAVNSSGAIEAHIQAGRKALTEGSFRLAEEQLATARTLREQYPQALRASESRSLNRLHRQAALLASSLPRPLEEILRQASGIRNEEEWRKQFEANYQGRGVVFDDRVRRDALGNYRLMTYDLRIGFGKDAESARLEIGELRLFRLLPLDQPQRLLFGARLARVAREPPGVWVVRFEPDSAVLLTDPGAVAAFCPQPLDDELREVLKRQAEWDNDLP